MAICDYCGQHITAEDTYRMFWYSEPHCAEENVGIKAITNYPTNEHYKQLTDLKIKIAEIIAKDSNSDIEKLAMILKVIKE